MSPYWLLLPSPCSSSCCCCASFDSELLRTVPPYLDIASTALSGVTFSMTMNRAEVPGLSMSRTWSWNCLSTALLVTLPISAPIPAPTAMPRNGTKNSIPNSMPQNIPQVAPPPTAWWLVTTRILPSLFRMIAATASAWMTSSCCSRSASSIADSAVVSSGYPIAIRSAICASLPGRPANAACGDGTRFAGGRHHLFSMIPPVPHAVRAPLSTSGPRKRPRTCRRLMRSSQPGGAFGPVQRILHQQRVGDEPREQQADPFAVGAQHRVAKLQVPEQCQQLGGGGADPERGNRLDPQQAVPRQGLDRLVAAEGGTGQDALDRVVLEAEDEPLGLELSARGEGPERVRACPGSLVAGVGVPHYQQHGSSLKPPTPRAGAPRRRADVRVAGSRA